MSSFIPEQALIGQIFAIAGLALVPFNTFFRRTYSSVLDATQMSYLFTMVLSPSIQFFSKELYYCWLSFMKTFLEYCTDGDFSCNYGYLLSPLMCWVGASILLMWLEPTPIEEKLYDTGDSLKAMAISFIARTGLCM